MTRLPAPAFVELGVTHRVARIGRGLLRLGQTSTVIVTRCGRVVNLLPQSGTLMGQRKGRICRVCEPRRAVDR